MCVVCPAAAGSLSVVEVGKKRVKFAAGAYVGTLETPEQMAVFMYYLDVSTTRELQGLHQWVTCSACSTSTAAVAPKQVCKACLKQQAAVPSNPSNRSVWPGSYHGHVCAERVWYCVAAGV